ncbi:WXG100 protein secretion system (Wss), protein YukD [Streptococcus equinus]|uniref:WXG100 protein secretion system (Wss), protein YukD n=1 Tax=Streptococcus equinus TaxID=1335 RepID=A0A1H0NCA6_STREI|nr:EsaB/YukD family protein [Streptococcus equinus]SDO90317.1 WXG100 protein secretion system (Wss), protein YukD [Streptococcus equinus]
MAFDNIDITIAYQDRQIDLRISRGLSLVRLEELLRELNILSRLGFVEKDNQAWKLCLKNKAITLNRYEMLVNFPLGNGDILEIRTYDI